MRRTWLAPLLGTLILLGGSAVVARPAEADDLASAQARATKAAAAEATAESALGRLSAQINDLNAEKADATARLAVLRDAARQVVIERYMNADGLQVGALSGDINDQARADALSRFATQGNQDAIDGYTAASEDLDHAQAGLAQKQTAQKRAVADLKAKERDLEAQLKKLQAADAAKKKAAKAASGSGRVVGVIATGAFVCPVQGPVAFTDSYGAPRSGGRRHQGVDMMSPRGTPTVAPVGGSVSYRSNSLGGNAWHLNGDDGNYYYGAHLESYSGASGHVAAGTVLGYVGNTGDAAGGATHLHFEIHPHHGAAVDPTPTVRKYC